MSNKKGIELSINFIVIIILSIVIFSFGIYFLNSIFIKGRQIQMTIDEQTKEQITRLLIGGEKVALPYHTERIDRGGYNLFALGIMNVVGEGKRFDIVVGCDSFIKLKPEEETLPCPEEVNNWVEMNQRQITLPNNDHRVIGILVKVPRDAAAGIYVFNVGVRYPDGKLYGTLQKMYVEV